MPFFRPCWPYLLLLSLVYRSAAGQSNSFRQIEQRVYQYNNALAYKKSQALLLPILSSAAYSADEHYQAAILLSYTYKRLFDYTTTLQFLNEAEQLASKTTRPDANRTNVQVQKAYVYFDTHAYAKAKTLMDRLARLTFKNVGQEDRAKLIHQQGYLLFLDRQYPAAEATYDRALCDLKASSGCDQPMILVKKMQLYAAMNRMDLALRAFNESNRCADSCGIIKYQLYAHEELSQIYKDRHDATGFSATMQRLNALNKVYAQGENIATLHNQKETIRQQAVMRQLSDQRRLNWLLGGGILAGLALLLGGALVYRRQQRQLTNEAVLLPPVTASLAPGGEGLPRAAGATPAPRQLTNLSERQQLILGHVVKGLSNREIAELLCVSENTVKYHLKNIYDELDVKSRIELVTRLREP